MRSEQSGHVADGEFAAPVTVHGAGAGVSSSADDSDTDDSDTNDEHSVSERGAVWRYLACIAIAYLLLRLLGPAWRTGFPASFPDSSSYVDVAESGLLSWDFWFGRRPPTYPLLIWLLGPSPRAVIVAQTLIAIASWTWLASTVWTMVRSRWVAAATVAVLLLVAIESRWLVWNTALLTESLSASLAVAGVAAWWRWWAEPSTFRTVAASAITVAWMLLRDSNAVALLAVVVPAFVVLIRMERRRTSDRRRLLAIAFTAMIVVGGYSVTAQVVSNRGETSFHNNVSLRYLTDAEMSAWMEARGMPLSPALLDRAGKDAWADDQAMLRSPGLTTYRRWADGTGKVAAAASFVVKADWYLERADRELPLYTATDHLAYDTFGVADHFPERPLWIFDPVDSRGSFYVWTFLSLVALALLWVRRRTWAWFGLFLVVPVLVDLYLVFAADAVEVSRHLVGPMLSFSVVSTVAVALAADVALDARSEPGRGDG